MSNPLPDIPAVFIPPPLPAFPAPVAPGSLTEYQYHGQYSLDTIGIVINIGGVPQDVDNQLMSVIMYPLANMGTSYTQETTPDNLSGPIDTDGTPVFTATASNPAVGVYEYRF